MAPTKNDEITEKQSRSLLQALRVAFLVGVGLSAGGLYFAQFQIALALHGETTLGEVMDLEAADSTSSSGRAAWFPVVVFRTRDGQQITFRHRTGHNPPEYAKGDKVPVNYLPDQPERALVAEGLMNWLLPGLLLLIGSGLIAVTLRGIIAMRRNLVR